MASLKDKKEKLEKQFNNIKNSAPKIDPQQHLVTQDDVPDFGEIEIYNYDTDISEAQKEATYVIESLVDLYLGSNPAIKNHPYIKNKISEDTVHFAESKLLSKMTRKLLIQQLRQIDNGDNGARMYEVANQTIKEQRENNKYASTIKTDIESFYRDIREDLGISGEEVSTESGDLLDTKELNDKINDAIKKKRS